MRNVGMYSSSNAKTLLGLLAIVLSGAVTPECDYRAALGLGSGLIELLLLALDSKFYKFVPFAVEI